MITAYMLIQSDIELRVAARELISHMQAVEGVLKIDCTTGPYDFVLVVQAQTDDGIGKIILEVQQIRGVQRTLTCPIIELS